MEDRQDGGSNDPEASWARVRDDLHAYREVRRRYWGDIDEVTLARYLAGEADPTVRAQIEKAAQANPTIRRGIDLLEEILRPEYGEKASMARVAPAILDLRTIGGVRSLVDRPLDQASHRVDAGLNRPGASKVSRVRWLSLGLAAAIMVVAVNLMIGPTVQQAREPARRIQCSNNLKQIGLALANYESFYGRFPPAFLSDHTGKPLLSWRVAILPFLGDRDLYEEFRLDEPWDSLHNQALIPKMPATFVCPASATLKGKTTYLTPRGPATVFPGTPGIRLEEITDGTSRTIVLVEVGDDQAVVWTKPDDWDSGRDPRPLARHPGGISVAFADGKVAFLKSSTPTHVYRALSTRNGGESLGADDF